MLWAEWPAKWCSLPTKFSGPIRWNSPCEASLSSANRHASLKTWWFKLRHQHDSSGENNAATAIGSATLSSRFSFTTNTVQLLKVVDTLRVPQLLKSRAFRVWADGTRNVPATFLNSTAFKTSEQYGKPMNGGEDIDAADLIRLRAKPALSKQRSFRGAKGDPAKSTARDRPAAD